MHSPWSYDHRVPSREACSRWLPAIFQAASCRVHFFENDPRRRSPALWSATLLIVSKYTLSKNTHEHQVLEHINCMPNSKHRALVLYRSPAFECKHHTSQDQLVRRPSLHVESQHLSTAVPRSYSPKSRQLSIVADADAVSL